jgi:ferritin heavy chain
MTSCNLGNWNAECESVVNKQINLEYWASYQYDLMASYFDRSSVGLKNISTFFKKSSDEEREHAHKLIEYQNKRGGRVIIEEVTNINNEFYNSSLDKSNLLQAFELALEMEQHVYKSLLELHKLGETYNDPALTDFIEGEYLTEQIDGINELSSYVSQLTQIGDNSAGLWMFNKEFEV